MGKEPLYIIKSKVIDKYIQDKPMLNIYLYLRKHKKILQLTSLGKTAKEIAAIEKTSERTIECIINQMQKKIQCKNKVLLVDRAKWLQVI